MNGNTHSWGMIFFVFNDFNDLHVMNISTGGE